MHLANSSGGGTGRRPREVTGRIVFICFVAFFGVVAGVNAIMVRAAVSTFGGIETENAYKAGLAFANEIAAADAQKERRWQVRATVLPDAQGFQRIEMFARDAADRPLNGLTAIVALHHPTNRRSDQAILMTETEPGHFIGTTALVAGQWDLVIDLERDGERMFRSKSRVVLR